MADMRKGVIPMLLCLCTCAAENTVASRMSSQTSTRPVYTELVPPDKLKEDLDFLFKTIEEVHPNMYAYIDKEEFDLLREELNKNIESSVNRLQFYKLAAPVVASLKNGHTFIKPPITFFQDYALKEGKFFPLEMQIEEARVILSKHSGPYDLPLGAEVLTIDDQVASEFLRKAASYSPSEGRAYNLAVLQRKSMLPFYLWLEKGSENSLGLEVKMSNGQGKKKYDIKALTYKEIVSYQKSLADKMETDVTSKPENSLYSHRYLQVHDTSIIEFNMFHDMQQFKEFLRQTFTEIHDNNVSNLIIDIRKNPGGSSSLGDELLKYLTDKPFRQFESVQIKMSRQLCKAHPGLRKSYPRAKMGSMVTMEGGFKQADNRPLRFKGRVFLLIGPKSASSSVSFASAMKHFHIGTLIGQETIDTPVNYGDIIYEKLPHSGLTFAVACKRFVCVGGKTDGRGLLPHYEIRQKQGDTSKSVDTVLQFTLDLIRDDGTVLDMRMVN
ncbi:S41 family peptidase [Planctomycetota bacterium]